MNGETWKVELTSRALRQYRKFDDEARSAARGLFDELESEGPAVFGAVIIRAHRNTWRAKFYRERYPMVSRVSVSKKTIVVTKMGPRGTIYKGMKDDNFGAFQN